MNLEPWQQQSEPVSALDEWLFLARPKLCFDLWMVAFLSIDCRVKGDRQQSRSDLLSDVLQSPVCALLLSDVLQQSGFWRAAHWILRVRVHLTHLLQESELSQSLQQEPSLLQLQQRRLPVQ